MKISNILAIYGHHRLMEEYEMVFYIPNSLYWGGHNFGKTKKFKILSCRHPSLTYFEHFLSLKLSGLMSREGMALPPLICILWTITLLPHSQILWCKISTLCNLMLGITPNAWIFMICTHSFDISHIRLFTTTHSQ